MAGVIEQKTLPSSHASLYAHYSWYKTVVEICADHTHLDLVCKDIVQRMESKEWKSDPHLYVQLWQEARGYTEELRFPEDRSLQIMKGIVKKLPKTSSFAEMELKDAREKYTNALKKFHMWLKRFDERFESDETRTIVEINRDIRLLTRLNECVHEANEEETE
jgi:hypothetical protein